MKLRARRTTQFDRKDKDGWVVGFMKSGTEIQLNLDDFEVVDGFNPQYCSFGLDKVELEPDTPKIEKLGLGQIDNRVAIIDISLKINLLIDAVNRLEEHD